MGRDQRQTGPELGTGALDCSSNGGEVDRNRKKEVTERSIKLVLDVKLKGARAAQGTSEAPVVPHLWPLARFMVLSHLHKWIGIMFSDLFLNVSRGADWQMILLSRPGQGGGRVRSAPVFRWVVCVGAKST